MTRRWTAEDVARLPEGMVANCGVSNAPRGTKYRNQKCTFNGLQFDSRLEMNVYRELAAAALAGYIRAVIRQVSLPLPQSTRRIRIDFAIVEKDGRIRFCDAKGFETAAWRGKREQVRTAYGIEIELRREAARGFV